MDIFYQASTSRPGVLQAILPGAETVPGTITFSGTPEPGQTVTVNLAGATDWSYVTVEGDTLDSIIANLAAIIESGDPNVSAAADLRHQALLLTARTDIGSGLSFAVSVSGGTKFSATSDADVVPGTVMFSATPEPGQTVTINLGGSTDWSYTTVAGDTLDSVITKLAALIEQGDPNVSATADLTNRALSLTLRGGAAVVISLKVTVSGDDRLAATSSRQFLQHVPVSVTNDVIDAVLGEALPLVPGDVFIAGSPEPGQTLTLTLGDASYSYTIAEGDTLANIVTNLAAVMTDDPNVVATVDTTQLSIALALRVSTSDLKVTVKADLTGPGALLVLVRSAQTTGSAFAGVTFAGPVEGLVGLYQVNFTVPSEATTDPATKLTVIQNQIVFGSVTQYDILSNIVTFPVATE
jgi:phage tail sheath gpL-like